MEHPTWSCSSEPPRSGSPQAASWSAAPLRGRKLLRDSPDRRHVAGRPRHRAVRAKLSREAIDEFQPTVRRVLLGRLRRPAHLRQAERRSEGAGRRGREGGGAARGGVRGRGHQLHYLSVPAEGRPARRPPARGRRPGQAGPDRRNRRHRPRVGQEAELPAARGVPRDFGSTTSSARRRRRTSSRSLRQRPVRADLEPQLHRPHPDRRPGDARPRDAGVVLRVNRAFRDMVVTHLMQVLAFMAMEPPTSLAPRRRRREAQGVPVECAPLEPHNVVRGSTTATATSRRSPTTPTRRRSSR